MRVTNEVLCERIKNIRSLIIDFKTESNDHFNKLNGKIEKHEKKLSGMTGRRILLGIITGLLTIIGWLVGKIS